MAEIIDSGKFDREAMLIAAAELMVVRLPKVAKLVRNAATKCPSIGDDFWPYSDSVERDPTHIRAAEASAERRLIRWRKRIAELLHKANLTLDWVEED
jgi:hypothetical protein